MNINIRGKLVEVAEGGRTKERTAMLITQDGIGQQTKKRRAPQQRIRKRRAPEQHPKRKRVPTQPADITSDL